MKKQISHGTRETREPVLYMTRGAGLAEEGHFEAMPSLYVLLLISDSSSLSPVFFKE